MKQMRPFMRHDQLLTILISQSKIVDIIKDKSITFLKTDKGYSKQACGKK